MRLQKTALAIFISCAVLTSACNTAQHSVNSAISTDIEVNNAELYPEGIAYDAQADAFCLS